MPKGSVANSKEARYTLNLGYVRYSALGVTGGLLCGVILPALFSAMTNDAEIDIALYLLVLVAGCLLITFNFVGLFKRGIQIEKRTDDLEPEPENKLRHTIREKSIEQILSQLRQLQAFCGKPMAARYASKLLKSMRNFRDSAELDPYTEAVMTLYDALAFEDNWNRYTSKQYQGAYEVLKELGKHRHLSEGDVERAITILEDLGFDTTPFNMDVAQDDLDDDSC